MSAVNASIVKQVEFYFSDSNLPRDKFLSGLVKKNEEGWCPIQVIASFQRMKKITEDIAVVVAALKESDFLVVSEDDVNVRRKVPLAEGKNDSMERSVYMKGITDTATLEEIQEFLGKNLEEGEKLLYTRMRRFNGGDNDKKFKGSIFAELNSAAAAQRVSKLTLKYTEDGEALLVMEKSAYVNMKKAELKAKGKNVDSKPAKSNKRKAEEEEKEQEITKDLIISIGGLGEEASREELKSALETAGGSVKYVEYQRGQEAGFVRLDEKGDVLATALCAKLTEANTEIKGKKATFTALSGEEEVAYWTKVRENQKNKRAGNGPRRKRTRD